MQAIKVGDDFSNCTELVRRLKDLGYSNTNTRNTTLALTDDGIRIVYKSEDSHNTKWVNFFNPTKKEFITYANKEDIPKKILDILPEINDQFFLFYKHHNGNKFRVVFLGMFRLYHIVTNSNVYVQIWKKQKKNIQIRPKSK